MTLATATAPYNEFTQSFASGSSVSFNVNASGLRAPTGTAPDEFIVDLYDNTAATPVPTTNASGDGSPAGFELFTITPSAQGNTTQTYGYTGTNGFDATHSQANGVLAVPEPSPWTTLCLGLGVLLLNARKRRSRSGV